MTFLNHAKGGCLLPRRGQRAPDMDGTARRDGCGWGGTVPQCNGRPRNSGATVTCGEHRGASARGEARLPATRRPKEYICNCTEPRFLRVPFRWLDSPHQAIGIQNDRNGSAANSYFSRICIPCCSWICFWLQRIFACKENGLSTSPK